ncbi:MAG TPA: hypothetical protein VIA62_20100 [Thermoanaerobaculia bacterium]|jgi:hypothetical protein|nr:hypothetical protein [Thermoanaerobaculia bacterium]
MLLTSVPVRLFFYGLIAFVPSKDRHAATVIVQQELDHVPFVWWNKSAIIKCTDIISGSCTKTFPFYGKNLPGSLLKDGAAITVTGVTDQGSPQLSLNGDGKSVGYLPTSNVGDALYFQWVPSFADFHDDSESRIDKACLTDPKCGTGAVIAGRMMLTAGTLSTCRLRTYKNDRVYPIVFSDTGTMQGKKRPQRQALAEIVVLETRATNGKVMLSVGSDFSVSLEPAGASEIDIVVGNLPKTVSGGYGDTKGQHFAILHKLLAATTSTALAMDIDNESTTIQPNCPVPFELPKFRGAQQQKKAKELGLVDKHATGYRSRKSTKATAPDPGSRPICPMAIMLPPS